MCSDSRIRIAVSKLNQVDRPDIQHMRKGEIVYGDGDKCPQPLLIFVLMEDYAVSPRCRMQMAASMSCMMMMICCYLCAAMLPLTIATCAEQASPR